MKNKNHKTEHRERSLVTMSQYARRKNVTRQAVIQNVQKGNIQVVHVGMDKDTYIDWADYKDFPINTRTRAEKV